MKNKSICTVIAIIVLAAALTFAGCSAIPAAKSSGSNSSGGITSSIVAVGPDGNIITANKLTVSATGSTKVMPDVAYVTVGVITQGKDIKKAQSENKKMMNVMFDALKKAELTDDDIRTTNYSVYPIYDYKNGSGKILRYEVTNMVELTINNIDNIGDYIDIAADSGANTSYAITFDLLDKNEHYNTALADALNKAKSKADTIALTGGYTIVDTLEITENSNIYQPYRDYAEAAMADEDTTPISAGELEVTAKITVIYEIE
ncbi:MAG: SIMPL domain-containing protein [Christensenellales bacterium]|jgi:uncharacterized protein YggE